MGYHPGRLDNYALTTSAATFSWQDREPGEPDRARAVIRLVDNSAMPLERKCQPFWPNEPNAGMPAILAKRTQREWLRDRFRHWPERSRAAFDPNRLR